MLCAAIVPGHKTGPVAEKMMETITNSCYEACKTGRKILDGFPDVRPMLEELRSLSEGQVANPTEPFKVTAAFPCGALVIRNQFFEQFSEIPEFQAVVDEHNSKYNPDKLSLQVPVAPQEDVPSGASKVEVLQTDDPIKEETVATIPAASAAQILCKIFVLLHVRSQTLPSQANPAAQLPVEHDLGRGQGMLLYPG